MIGKRITSMLMAILLVMTLLPQGQASSPLTSRRVPLSPRRMRKGERTRIRIVRIIVHVGLNTPINVKRKTTVMI